MPCRPRSPAACPCPGAPALPPACTSSASCSPRCCRPASSGLRLVIWQELQASEAEARRGLDEQARTLALTVDAADQCADRPRGRAGGGMAANGDDPPVFGEPVSAMSPARLGAGVLVLARRPESAAGQYRAAPGAALLPVLSRARPGRCGAAGLRRGAAAGGPGPGSGPLSHAWVCRRLRPGAAGRSRGGRHRRRARPARAARRAAGGRRCAPAAPPWWWIMPAPSSPVRTRSRRWSAKPRRVRRSRRPGGCGRRHG